MTKGATFVVAATVGGFLPGVEGSGIDGVPFDPKKPFTVQFCDEHGKTAGTVATRTQDGAVVWVTETGMKSGKYTELNFQFEEGSFRWDEDTEKQEVEQHGHTYRVQDEPPRGCGKISVAGQRGCLGTNAADKNKLILGQECGDDQKSIRWCLSSSNLDWNTGTDDKGEYFVHDKAPFSIAESNHLASTLWTGWIPTWWSEYDYVTSEASRKGHKSVFLKQDGGEINVARLQPPQSGSSAAPEQALHGEEEPGHEAEDVGTGEAGHALAGGNIFQDDLHEEDNVAAAFEELVDENGEPAWLLAPQDVADVWSDEGGSGVSLADVNPEETHTKYWAFLAEEGFRACRGRVCPCRVLSLVEKHDSGGVPSWNFVWVSPSGSASAAPDEKWWVDRSILESDEPACEPQTPRVNLCKVELGQPAADVQGDVRDEGGLEREAAAGAAAAPEAAEVPEAEAEADETERAAEAEAEAAAASPEAEAAPPPPPDSGQVAAEEILQGIQRGEAFTMTFTTGSSGDKIVHRVGGGWSPWISALTPDEVSLVPEGTGASNQFRLVEPLPSGTGSLCGKLEAIGAAPGSGKHFVTCPTFGTSNGFKVQLTGQSRLASVVCFEFQEGHGWRVTKSDGGRRRMVVQGRVPAGAKQSQNVLWTDNKKVPTDEAHVQIDLLVNAEHDDDPEAAQARSDYDYYHPHGKDPLETDDEHYRMYDQGTVNEDQNQGSPREESAGQDEKLGPYDEVEAAKGAGVEQERLEEWLGTPSSPAEEIPGQVVFDEKQPFVLKWANPLTKKGAEDVVAHVTGGSKMQKAEALQTLTADKMNQVEQKVMELQFFEPQAVQDGKGVTEICGKMYVVSGFEPWTSKCIQKGGLAQPTKLFPWRSCSGSTGIARGVAQKFCLFEQSAAADDGKGARFRIHAFGKPAELLTTRQDFGRGYSNNYLHLDPQVQLNAPKDLILVQGNQRVKALSEVKGPSTTAAFASGGTTAGTAVLHEEAGSGAWARSEKNAPKPSLVDPEVRIADPEVLPLLKHLRAGEVFTIKIANEKEPQKPYTVYRVDDEDATAVFGAPKPPHSLGAAKEPLQERLELSGEDETLRVSPNFKLVNVATQHKNNFEACGDLQALGDVGDQAAAEQLFVYRASMGYATKPGFQAKLVNQEKIGGLPWVCLKLNAQQQEGSMSWELKLDGKSMILGGSIIFTVGRDVSVQDVRWSDQLNLVRPIQIDLVQPQAMLGSEIATGGGPPAAEVGLVDPAVKDPLDDLERKVRQGAYSFRIVFAQGSAASEEGAFKTAIFTSPDYVSMLAYDETSERPARKKLASDHRDFSLVDHIRSGPTPGSPLCGKVKATEPKDSGKCLGWQRKGPGLSEVDCRTLGLVFCFHAKPRASDDASQPRFTITHTASKTESFKLALPEGESPYVHLLPDGEITKSHATEVLLPATGEVLRQAEEKLKEAAEAKAAAATPQLPQPQPVQPAQPEQPEEEEEEEDDEYNYDLFPSDNQARSQGGWARVPGSPSLRNYYSEEPFDRKDKEEDENRGGDQEDEGPLNEEAGEHRYERGGFDPEGNTGASQDDGAWRSDAGSEFDPDDLPDDLQDDDGREGYYDDLHSAAGDGGSPGEGLLGAERLEELREGDALPRGNNHRTENMNAREPRQKDITMSDEALAKREERIKKMRSASADDAEDGEAWLRANVLGVDLFGEGPEAEEAERKTFGDPPPPKTGQQVVPDGEQVEIGADLEMFLEAWELTQDRAVFRLKFQADDTQPDETGNARFVVRLNEASENLSLESQKISVLAKTEQEIGDKQSELDYEWLWWFYFTPQLTPHSCVQIATSPAITQNAKEVMSCLQWPPETGAEAFTVVDCVSGKSLQAFCVEKPRWDKDAFYFFRKITEEEDLEKDSSLLSVNADNGQLLSEIPAHGADGILRMYIDKQKQHNPPKPQQAVRKAKESEIQKEAWGALLSGNDGDEESPESVGGESSFDDSKVKGMLQLYSVRKKDEEEDEDGTTQASQSPVLAVTVDNGGGPEANLRVLPVIPATGSYYEWQFKTLIKFNEKFRGHEIPCGTMQLSQHSLTAGQQLCLQQDTGSGGNLVLKQCNTVGRLVCLNVVSPGEAESTRKPGRMRVELFFGDTVTLMELHNQKAQMSSPVLVKMDDLLRQEDSTPTRYDVEVVGEEGIERRKMVETLDAIVADPDHKAKLNRCLGMDAPEPSTDGGSFLEANYRLRDPHAQPQSPERRTGDVEDCISDIESAGDQGGSLMYQYAKRMARDSLGQSLDTEIRNMLDSARSPASKLAICSMAFEKSATQSDLQLRDRCLASAQGFEEIAANVASGEAPPAEMMRTKGFRQLFQNAKTLSRITQRKNTRGKPDEKAFRMRFVYKESDELRVVSAVLVHREGGGAESVILRRVDGTPEDIQTWFLIADDALSAGGDDGTENKIRASECGKILPSFRREGEAWKCLAAAGSDRLQMIDTGDGTVIGYGVKEKCPEWCFEATPSGIAVYLQSPQEHSKKFLTCRVSDPNAIRAKLGPPALVPNVEEQGRHAVLQIEGFTDLAELNPDLAEEYSKKWKKVKNSRQEDNAVFALQYGNARFGAVANEGARAKSEWMGAEQDAAEHYWIFIVANPDLSVNADTACGYLMSEHLVNADTGRQDICLAQNFQELTVCSPEGNTICLKRMTRKLGGEAHVLELKLFVSEGQDDEDAGESTPEWLRIPYGEEDNADRDAGLLVESPTTTLLEYEAAQVKVLDPGQDENREAKVTRLLNLAEHRQQQQQGEEGAARNRYQTPHAADTALRFGSAFGTNADLSPQRRRPDVDPEPDWPEPEDVDADEETIRECIFDPVGYFFENRHYYPYSDHGVTRWRETLSQQDARDVTGRREVTLRQQCGGCKIVEGPTQYAGVTTVWVHRLGRLYRADWNDEEQFEVTEKLPDVDGGGMATLVLDPTEDQQLATIFESGRSITTHCSTDSYAEHRAREV